MGHYVRRLRVPGRPRRRCPGSAVIGRRTRGGARTGECPGRAAGAGSTGSPGRHRGPAVDGGPAAGADAGRAGSRCRPAGRWAGARHGWVGGRAGRSVRCSVRSSGRWSSRSLVRCSVRSGRWSSRSLVRCSVRSGRWSSRSSVRCWVRSGRWSNRLSARCSVRSGRLGGRCSIRPPPSWSRSPLCCRVTSYHWLRCPASSPARSRSSCPIRPPWQRRRDCRASPVRSVSANLAADEPGGSSAPSPANGDPPVVPQPMRPSTSTSTSIDTAHGLQLLLFALAVGLAAFCLTRGRRMLPFGAVMPRYAFVSLIERPG